MQYNDDYKINATIEAYFNRKIAIQIIRNCYDPKLTIHAVQLLATAQATIDSYWSDEEKKQVIGIVGTENVAL